MSDLRGKNAESTCFRKTQGVAIGKRIKNLKEQQITTEKGVTGSKTNLKLNTFAHCFS